MFCLDIPLSLLHILSFSLSLPLSLSHDSFKVHVDGIRHPPLHDRDERVSVVLPCLPRLNLLHPGAAPPPSPRHRHLQHHFSLKNPKLLRAHLAHLELIIHARPLHPRITSFLSLDLLSFSLSLICHWSVELFIYLAGHLFLRPPGPPLLGSQSFRLHGWSPLTPNARDSCRSSGR